MEHRKIRVAITHGDTNGIGYELIFKAFAEPQMFDLCIPIIYGSPKIAAYHRKALDIQANFSIINNAEEACEGRINMLACFDEEVKVAREKEIAGMRDKFARASVCYPLSSHLSPRSSQDVDVTQDSFDTVRYCTHCRGFKPPRAHHCRFAFQSHTQKSTGKIKQPRTGGTVNVSGALCGWTTTARGWARVSATTTRSVLFSSFCTLSLHCSSPRRSTS